MLAQIFFHANATLKYRRNFIASLKTDLGEDVLSHASKENLIWESFKDRIRKSEFSGMLFDLNLLIQRNTNLSHLEEQFTTDEIDAIVKQLPNDKSPGPDGFTNEFIKKCWSTVKHDFYNLCWAFFENNLCLQSINTSFITLIPKVTNPSTVSDFRPISLLNTSMKLITKILANRLQKIIIPLIRKNQYGFIKERTIQDCLA